MTELNFKGKEFVYNHHLSVPFHPLEPQPDKGIGEVALDGSLIIQGDNLKALKALIPTHAGRVNCVYIDPPYNTGNEKWCYNDKVNSPMIKEWFSENPVDFDDGLRHDKWCAMMWPRLRLLHELLAEDGVIFVSIDDNEQYHLRMLMDEIFGEENFFAQTIVRANSRGQTYKQIAKTHEYLFIYTKNPATDLFELEKAGNRDDLIYNDDSGSFSIRELRNRNPKFGKHNRPNLFYPIYVGTEQEDEDGFYPVSLEQTKDCSLKIEPFNSAGKESCWRWGTEKTLENISADTRKSNLVARKMRHGGFAVFEKYRKNTYKLKSIWDENKFLNETGTVELGQFNLDRGFDFPKPVSLIEQCVRLACAPNAIILDSFAGSGTTAHAVLALNKEDGGNRKFILVECEKDYADTITAERARRVIRGVPEARDESLREGLGGSFTYCALGPPVELDAILTGKALPAYDQLGALLFRTATNRPLDPAALDRDSNYLGEAEGRHIWLIYRDDLDWLKSPEAAFTLSFARRIAGSKPPDARHLAFAPARFVSQELLAEERLPVEFAPLPFALYRIELTGRQ